MKTSWLKLTIAALLWGAAYGCVSELPGIPAGEDALVEADGDVGKDSTAGETPGDDRRVVAESDASHPQDGGVEDARAPDGSFIPDFGPEIDPDVAVEDVPLPNDAELDAAPDAAPDVPADPDAEPDAAPDAAPDVPPDFGPCGPPSEDIVLLFWRDGERSSFVSVVSEENDPLERVRIPLGADNAIRYQSQAELARVWISGDYVRMVCCNHEMSVYDPGRAWPAWPGGNNPDLYEAGDPWLADVDENRHYNFEIHSPPEN
jgi:hypothetical protein